jgi:hypothetical protein
MGTVAAGEDRIHTQSRTAAKGTLTLPISTVVSLTTKTPPDGVRPTYTNSSSRAARAIVVSGNGRSQFEGEIRWGAECGLLLGRKALRV